MSFRVDVSDLPARPLRLTVSGTLSTEQLPEIDRLVAAAIAVERAVEMDLAGITVIDRAALRYFVKGAGRRATIVACPSYVREWMRCEARHEDDRP